MSKHFSIVAFTLQLWLFCGCNDRNEAMNSMSIPKQPDVDTLHLIPESESAKRAAILPTRGSEDVSSLLGVISISQQATSEPKEYLPNTATEWIVHATIAEPLVASEVDAKFGQDWRAKYGGLTIYGRDTANGLWTYLISSDGPKKVDGLQFAWDYHDSWKEGTKLVPPSMYEARLSAVETMLSTLTKATVRSDTSPADAYQRAELLSKLEGRYDRSVTVRLAAPPGERLGGREIWDVMLCLGLQWGDMDCFHWVNPTGYGDSYYFSVWTSTSPGYFLPEQIAADRVNVEDLVFGFSIPRCADPVKVYDGMVRGMKYAQKRLGGELQTEDGKRFDEKATAREIETISDELKQLGFPPGSDNALRRF